MTVAVVGLIYDISGATVLIWALAFARNGILKSQGGTYFNFNSRMLEALVEQRIDAQFGLGLLIFGFALQAIGSIAVSLPLWIDELLLAGLAIVLIVYVCCRKRLARRQGERLRAELLEEAERGNRPGARLG